ncbi:hypothetical protein V8J82_06310 [Gymnodinialimonas sp. 2305UL16-5]|uniref:hypothetical protein n=1 Tax=Gymnodinialimonas mytili TaxID=3126503 RepID=UPI0030A65BE4
MRTILFGLTLAIAAPAAATANSVPIADLRPEQNATIVGTVEQIVSYDEFVLADQSGSVHIYIGANEMPVAVGDQVHVSGVLDDGLAPEFYARQIVFADGQTVTLSRGY